MKLSRRDLLRSLVVGGGNLGFLGPWGRAAFSLWSQEKAQSEPAPAPLTSGIAAGTASVPSVEDAVNQYCKWFDYVVHWRGKVTAAQATLWEAPGVAGHPAALVGPKDMQQGLIRFVEVSVKPTPAFTTRGWTALELRTRNVDELAQRLEGSPFKRIGGPADLTFAKPPRLRAMQALGLGGEALYCTQSLLDPNGPYPGGQLGPNNVGTLFIVVLACWPYPATRDFYIQTLGMKLGFEAEFALRFANRYLGWPADRKGVLATARSGPSSLIELDGYPEEVLPRPTPGGSLPSGVSICTLEVPDIEKVARALQAASIPFRRLSSRLSEPLYRKRPALALRGRSGEIVELVENKEAPPAGG